MEVQTYKMRKININGIKGNEVLAKDVYSKFDTILMPVGTIIKMEYKERLKDLNINHIFIEDDISKGVNTKEITEIQIKEECQKAVTETLDKFIQCGNSELEKIKEVAEKIVNELLEQPEIIYNMSGVREENEDVYAHSINVCGLSVFIALRMKLPKEKVKEIAVGSLLHDIGFKFIKRSWDGCTYDQLAEKEKKELKMHVVYGYSAVEYETWISKMAKDIILNHHEKVDGTGYPRHLKKEKLNIGTNIVSVCDTFDRYVYGIFNRAKKVHEVIEYIVGQGGKKFDIEVVKVFNKSVAAYPNGTVVLTNKSEMGIVLRQNISFPTRPIIRLLRDAQGRQYKDWIEKDLVKELTLFIVDTIE